MRRENKHLQWLLDDTSLELKIAEESVPQSENSLVEGADHANDQYSAPHQGKLDQLVGSQPSSQSSSNNHEILEPQVHAGSSPEHVIKTTKNPLVSVWDKTKQIISDVQTTSAKIGEKSHIKTDLGDSPTDIEASPKKLQLRYRDLILAAFPFDQFNDSYCLFGSFRRRTSTLEKNLFRPYEVVGNSQMIKEGRVSSKFKLDFAIASLTSANNIICRTQIRSYRSEPVRLILVRLGNDYEMRVMSLTRGGLNFHDVRFWILCRAHGPEAGLLADWTTFNFARRLLLWVYGTHQANQKLSNNESAKLSLDNPQSISEILKVTCSEINEDFALAFAENNLSAHKFSKHNAGVVFAAGFVVGCGNFTVQSILGDIVPYLITNRAIINTKTLAGQMPISRAISNTTAEDFVISRSVFLNSHRFSNPGERMRIRAALAKAHAAEVAKEQVLRTDVNNDFLDTRRRLIALKKKRMLPADQQKLERHEKLKAEEESFPVLVTTKRRWIEDSLNQSAMKGKRAGFESKAFIDFSVYDISRGIGFVSSQRFGMTSSPDLIELEVDVLRPRMSIRESDAGSQGSDNTPYPSQFLLVCSSPRLWDSIKHQEVAEKMMSFVKLRGASIQQALISTAMWIKRMNIDGLSETEFSLIAIPLKLGPRPIAALKFLIHDLVQENIFTIEEGRSISKRNRTFSSAALNAVESKGRLEAYLSWISFLIGVQCILKDRLEKSDNENRSIKSLNTRMFNVVKGSMKSWRATVDGDLRVDLTIIDYFLKCGRTKSCDDFIEKCLLESPCDLDFWMLAITRQREVGNIEAALNLAHKAYRFFPEEPTLRKNIENLALMMTLLASDDVILVKAVESIEFNP